MASQKIIVQSLNDLIKYKVRALLRRSHLNRDVLTGLLGDRGDGKSTTGAQLALRDYMMAGEPCWANLQIKCTVSVSDEVAAPYGLAGGEVVYEAQALEKHALLNLSDKYKGGCLFVDEINVAYAEARRAMSNTNLLFDDVGQELRKLDSALIYTVIDEMFVDNRIRELTDNFIRCSDTALTPEGLRGRKRPGETIRWVVYAMSRKLNGTRYADTHRPIDPPFFIPNKSMWGSIDTWQKQERRQYLVKMQADLPEGFDAAMEVIRDQHTVEVESKWGWLYDKIKELRNTGTDEMVAHELWKYLNLEERGLTPNETGIQLAGMGITKRQVSGGFYTYEIDKFDLDKLATLSTKDRKVGVLVK